MPEEAYRQLVLYTASPQATGVIWLMVNIVIPRSGHESCGYGRI